MNQAGLVALGAASVYGGVGYLFAISMSEWGLSPAGALVASMAVVTIYSAILGALIIRTTPLAFMMLTLAAGEMISHGVMLEGLRDYTSGADGLVVSFNGTLCGLQAADFANPVLFWPVVWSAAWIAALAVWAMRSSRLGAVLRAIRDDAATGTLGSEGCLRPLPCTGGTRQRRRDDAKRRPAADARDRPRFDGQPRPPSSR
jgi:branched-chain amino acid transport system permease protein